MNKLHRRRKLIFLSKAAQNLTTSLNINDDAFRKIEPSFQLLLLFFAFTPLLRFKLIIFSMDRVSIKDNLCAQITLNYDLVSVECCYKFENVKQSITRTEIMSIIVTIR